MGPSQVFGSDISRALCKTHVTTDEMNIVTVVFTRPAGFFLSAKKRPATSVSSKGQ